MQHDVLAHQAVQDASRIYHVHIGQERLAS